MAIKEHIKVNGNGSVIAAIAIVALSLALGLRHIGDFPAYIHAWAQSDWYSIAVGFQNNGYDFFHPETLIYNKQFPGTWMEDYGDTVTSVDFPIHEYIVALLMSLFGTTAPWVFRMWTMIVSVVGLWFLYLMARRLTDSTLKALAVVLLCATTPLYAYYFNSFLPCAPSMALVMAGLWAYIRYRQENRARDWHLAVALLAMATLIRTSQAVTLVAVCGYELLRILRGESKMGVKWVSVVLSIAAVIGYYLWNRHLISQHGTLFLGELRPPRNWDDVSFVYDHVKYSWKWQYFTRLQHWVVAVVLVTALVLIVLRRRNRGDNVLRGLSLWWLAAIWLFGELCFVVAMMRQYVDHDYYFLDSLYLPIVFLFALALKSLPALRGHLPIATGTVVLLLLGGVMFNAAKHAVDRRCQPDDRALLTARHFYGSAAWLDEVGVPRDAKLLAVLAYPQNTPFILMERKGYTMMWCQLCSDEEYDPVFVGRMLDFDYDYIVMEDSVYAARAQLLAPLVERLEKVAGNGEITLYRLQP